MQGRAAGCGVAGSRRRIESSQAASFGPQLGGEDVRMALPVTQLQRRM